MLACTAIDWLQLYVKLPQIKLERISRKYKIVKEGYQTRHFKAVYTIYHKDDEIATLACNPHSNILTHDGGLLKFHNKYLYQQNLRQFVEAFLKECCFQFISISRLDIAYDFTRFNYNLRPEKFISGYFAKRYIKTGRSKGKAHFDQGKDITYSYIKFGSETSDISYYLYNKSKELNEVKMKGWICDHWSANKWDGKSEVWRIEFSLKLSSKAISDKETGEMYDLKTLEIIDDIQHQKLFKLLFCRYFSFTYNQGLSRKDRMKPVKLLSFEKVSSCKVSLSEKKESNRSSKIFAKKMMELNSELRGHDFNLSIFTQDLLSYFIVNRGLTEWASKKLPDFNINSKWLEKNMVKTLKELLLQLDPKQGQDIYSGNNNHKGNKRK